jgi:ribonuclease HII
MTVAHKVKRPNLRLEKELLRGGTMRLAAMDEVGRGALAGPVTVGVVVVTATIGRVPPGLADSKLLTPAAREKLVTPIRRWVTEYAVGHASPAEIDSIGIIAALRTAGQRALRALSGPVDAVLLDGNHNYLTTPAVLAEQTDDPPLFELAVDPARPVEPRVHVRIKADMTCAAVAGASVLAKTERDRLLVDLSPAHPVYGFAINKGYGTPEHVAALREYGPSSVHRRSWRLPGEEPDLFCNDESGGDVLIISGQRRSQ